MDEAEIIDLDYYRALMLQKKQVEEFGTKPKVFWIDGKRYELQEDGTYLENEEGQE